MYYCSDAPMKGGILEKQLTITLDEQFSLDLESAYRQMAQDEKRESEALKWAEATIGDVGDETR